MTCDQRPLEPAVGMSMFKHSISMWWLPKPGYKLLCIVVCSGVRDVYKAIYYEKSSALTCFDNNEHNCQRLSDFLCTFSSSFIHWNLISVFQRRASDWERTSATSIRGQLYIRCFWNSFKRCRFPRGVRHSCSTVALDLARHWLILFNT